MMPDRRYQSVLLFGAPGSGKGTQGSILGAIPGFFHLSSGDIFRSIDINSEIGRVFMDYSSRGELVPDEITMKMWRQILHAHTILNHYKPHDDLLVLDGIPRNVEQAKILESDINVLKVIHLDCPDRKLMVERIQRRALKENRQDDARAEAIAHRWDVYVDRTRPVLDYYSADRVCVVNAALSPSQVLLEVLKHAVPAQDQHFHNQKLIDDEDTEADVAAPISG